MLSIQKRALLRRFSGIFTILLLTLAAAVGQTRPSNEDATVLLRNTPGRGPAGNYELLTFRDGKVAHTENIGAVSFFAYSRDRLVTAGEMETPDTMIRVYELPEGKAAGKFTLPNMMATVLMQGADEWGVIDHDSAYFTFLEGHSSAFLKINMANGEFERLSFPHGGGGIPNLRRAGEFLLMGSDVFSPTEQKFVQSIPKPAQESVVYVPHDGLYSYNIRGQFTHIADDSLQPTIGAARTTQTIVRGVFAAISPGTPATDKTLVALSGPSRNGELRNEAIEPALTFARPSEGTTIASLHLSFIPTQRIFRAARENVIALINAADGTIVLYDCVAFKEIGRISVPRIEGQPPSRDVFVVH